MQRTFSTGLIAALAVTQAVVAWGACCCGSVQNTTVEVLPRISAAGHCSGCTDGGEATASHCNMLENATPIGASCAAIHVRPSEFSPLAATVAANDDLKAPSSHAARAYDSPEPKRSPALPRTTDDNRACPRSLSIINQTFLL